MCGKTLFILTFISICSLGNCNESIDVYVRPIEGLKVDEKGTVIPYNTKLKVIKFGNFTKPFDESFKKRVKESFELSAFNNIDEPVIISYNEKEYSKMSYLFSLLDLKVIERKASSDRNIPSKWSDYCFKSYEDQTYITGKAAYFKAAFLSQKKIHIFSQNVLNSCDIKTIVKSKNQLRLYCKSRHDGDLSEILVHKKKNENTINFNALAINGKKVISEYFNLRKDCKTIKTSSQQKQQYKLSVKIHKKNLILKNEYIATEDITISTEDITIQDLNDVKYDKWPLINLPKGTRLQRVIPKEEKKPDDMGYGKYDFGSDNYHYDINYIVQYKKIIGLSDARKFIKAYKYIKQWDKSMTIIEYKAPLWLTNYIWCSKKYTCNQNNKNRGRSLKVYPNTLKLSVDKKEEERDEGWHTDIYSCYIKNILISTAKAFEVDCSKGEIIQIERKSKKINVNHIKSHSINFSGVYLKLHESK